MERKAELDAARARLMDYVQKEMDSLGPRECGHGDWTDCGTCDFDDTKPVGGAMVSEFVMVMNVTTLERGEPFTIKHYSPGMLNTHTAGLLHTGLYEM